ncbi:MAG: hypothetical protein NXI28_25245 [bacterium]|jgi:hypothetical protein|nr:hypothetical protein [bacterium]
MKTLRDVNLPKTVVDTIPESVARECSVIAVALAQDLLTIACPDDSFGPRDEERVRFILDRPISWLRLPRSEIADAVQRHYVVDGAINDCGWTMRYQCPQRWRDLAPTDDEMVRHCNVCDRNVHACYTDESVAAHADKGDCVAIMDGFGGVELIGDVGH